MFNVYKFLCNHASYCRPELVELGDKSFGVYSRDRSSHVQEVTRELAVTFIQVSGGRKIVFIYLLLILI